MLKHDLSLKGLKEFTRHYHNLITNYGISFVSLVINHEEIMKSKKAKLILIKGCKLN